ncbi:MAG: zinc ribbon domain-containing protein [Candidatus Eisenbacteria bacterium]|jgi:putative FmdB family regulatory protein|nr:zinc ribbon domain-containing protein [Candidatus Eisenbacteria bacterium]
MPLYEYKCRQCGKVNTFLVGVSIHAPALRCARCGGDELDRLMSRVRHLLGEEDRMERMLDPTSLAGVDENDPKSIARWARKMGQGLGEEAGDDFDGMVDEMEDAAARESEGGQTGDDDDLA